ncbi:hypothetical protein MKW98_024355, partial [Papaver atlanticum]
VQIPWGEPHRCIICEDTHDLNYFLPYKKMRANISDAGPALRVSGVRPNLPGAPSFFYVFFQRGKTVTSV